MHGWTGSEDSGNELLHCDACFQRIGLWMYQLGYKPARSSPDDDDQTAAIVDMVELHREHCPWRNPDSQSALGTLKGLNACEVLQTCVSAFVKDERRREERQRRGVHQPETSEDGEDHESAPPSPAPSRDEIEKQDKERESRLKRLKSLFTIKRKSTIVSPPKPKPSLVGRRPATHG